MSSSAAPRVQGGHARMGVQDVRSSNLATVLAALVRYPTPPSRADLAHRTGLTRATVSRLVDSLLQSGVLTELDAAAGRAPGRPATPLVLRRGGVVAIGMEVNVSYLSVVAMDLSGEVLAQDIQTGDFLTSEPDPVLGRLGRMGRGVLDRLRDGAVHHAGVTLALPGLVSDSRLIQAPNLGWRDQEPASALDPDGALGPVRLFNEATAAAWSSAHRRPGVPAGPEDFLYLSGEAGIGGCVVSGSRPIEGVHGWAGEIGHLCVDPAGPVCSCGATGCLEAFIGHRYLMEAAGLPATTPTEGLVESARDGSTRAREALDVAARALGRGIAGAVNVLDVFNVVLGGDLAVLHPELEAEMYSELDRRTLGPLRVEVETATPGMERLAAARGGALSLLDPITANPAAHLDL